VITLFGFAPAFGLPSPGPFDLKTEIHLQMMGLVYRKICDGRANAPKGKLPYIDDDGTLVADSTFIRLYLEKKYSKFLDADLDDGQRAIAWTVERLVEDSLYWAMVHSRWAVDANFAKGPAHFFDHLPDDSQEDARQKQRTAVLGYLQAQGIGRRSAMCQLRGAASGTLRFTLTETTPVPHRTSIRNRVLGAVSTAARPRRKRDLRGDDRAAPF
jgi:hypothetical protein